MIDLIASLFRRPPSPPRVSFDIQLTGPRVLLRSPEAADWRAWHALRDLSRDSLKPWEPEWPDRALTYGYYCSLLRRYWRDWRAGKAFAFAIFAKDKQRLVLIGGVTLSDVHYAAAQKGTVGYWIGSPYTKQGYMTEALGLVCSFAFSQLKLQRVEASCLPNNEASKTVLRRSGFEEEGYAKAYLQINGKREDHLLWGKNNPNPKTK